MPSLLLVDDHEVFREGLRALLELEGDLEVIGDAGLGREALAFVRSQSPDVILLDLHLPDGLGADFCRELLRLSPASKVVILSAYEDDEEIMSALMAGASGYVLKTVGIDRLVESIRAVQRGEVLLAPSVAAKVVQRLSHFREKPDSSGQALSLLTPREREVFELASRGMRNAEIAAALVLSEKTVKTHLRNIYDKLELSNKADLRLFAQRSGLGRGGSGSD